MKHVFLSLFICCAICSFGQATDDPFLKKPKTPVNRNRQEFGINFTVPKQNLGIGITSGGNYFTSYNMYIGIGFELYYKHFNNSSLGVKVTNVSSLIPFTMGYKFSKDKFFAIPYLGLFGGGAWQGQTYKDTSGATISSVLIADWGYAYGIKLGYNAGKIWPFLRVVHYHNFDADKTDGNFFTATPITIGIMYPARTRKKTHHR